jgi:hypothetical protein
VVKDFCQNVSCDFLRVYDCQNVSIVFFKKTGGGVGFKKAPVRVVLYFFKKTLRGLLSFKVQGA